MNIEEGLSRRKFIVGTALGAAGIASAGLLYGCSQNDSGENGGESQPLTADETLEADIVVIGGGISGLSAVVQGAQLGKRMVILESMNALGGNGIGTEGVFAVGSELQREQGIEVTLADVVASEVKFFNYTVDALKWKDMVDASGENISWLRDNGVQFSGVVDSYSPQGEVPTFHWFDGSSMDCYITPMGQAAIDSGTEIRLDTKAVKITMTEGKVSGVDAQDADGKLIHINAPSAIIATGGFAGSPEKLDSVGIDSSLVNYVGLPGHNGEGLAMAVEAGAIDNSAKACFLRETTVAMRIGPGDFVGTFLWTTPSLVWVNQDAERFVTENCLVRTSGCMTNACTNQQQSFCIFPANILDSADAIVREQLQELIEANNPDIRYGETIEELAQAFDLDPNALAKTVERYNEFCDAGADEDFGKEAEHLVKLEGPFYAGRFGYVYMTSIGGIRSNRKGEVLSAPNQAIPGLYTAGTDGCELYGDAYTINIPGSLNGNNVFSGRNAARNAAAYLETL